jgi:hypothetical protein
LYTKGEALTESAVADLSKEAFYQNQCNAKIKYLGSIAIKKGKILMIHKIYGIEVLRLT